MEELFKAIGTYGLSPWMIFIIIIIFIVSKFYQKQIVGFFKNLFKGYTRSYKIKELINHDIFNTCERVKKEIKFEKFYTHGEFDATKTRMCQDFTNFKSDVCSKNFKLLINKTNIDLLGADELKNLIINEMNDMHTEYIKEIKNHWLSKGILIDDVDYIVELFEKFRYDVVNSFQHRIESTFACSFHKTNFDKMLACLDMFAMGIDLLPKDMLTTFESINGKFKNIKYEDK